MPVAQEMNFLVEQASCLFLNNNGATFQCRRKVSAFYEIYILHHCQEQARCLFHKR
ncbi:hypothetical protein QUB61_08760 [Microcoleus sp. C2D2]